MTVFFFHETRSFGFPLGEGDGGMDRSPGGLHTPPRECSNRCGALVRILLPVPTTILFLVQRAARAYVCMRPPSMSRCFFSASLSLKRVRGSRGVFLLYTTHFCNSPSPAPAPPPSPFFSEDGCALFHLF